jgi:hypothetical protein
MTRMIGRVIVSIATLAVAHASLGQSSVATADESGALLNIVRQFLERAGGTVAHDPAAETRVLGRLGTLRPVVEDDKVITLKQACNALNYWQGSQVSSESEALDWAATQGTSTRARTEAVRQVFETLVDLNDHPTLLGTQDQSGRKAGYVEFTGSALCLAQS